MSSKSFADEVLYLVPFRGRAVACLGADDAQSIADAERQIAATTSLHESAPPAQQAIAPSIAGLQLNVASAT